jgi:ATP-binding cassette subfamily B protein
MARHKKLREMLPGMRRFLRHIGPDVAAQRFLVTGSLAALFAEVLFILAEPWPLKFIIDRVVVSTPAGGGSGIALIDAMTPMTLLTAAAIAAVLIASLRALMGYANQVGFALVGQRVLTEVRSRLYRHLHSLSLAFHANTRNGELVIRSISDIGILKEVAVTAILPLLGYTVIVLCMVGVMAWTNWQMTLLALVTMPLYWLINIRIGRRIQTVARDQRQREGAMATSAAESFAAVKVIQTFSLGHIFAKAFTSHNKKSLREGAKAKRLAVRLERGVDVLLAISSALVLWYGARLVLTNALTPGDLLVFLFYLKGAFKPVRNLSKYTARLAKATASAERVIELFEIEPGIRDLPGAVTAPSFRGSVSFAGVDYGYDSKRLALDGIDATITAGQRVAVVGPSGGGKSTLVGLLPRLYDPLRGGVLIDGYDIRGYTLESLRCQISIVLQDSLLFADTISENIAFGAPGASDEEIEAAARLANAHDFISALPDGYETVLGERGQTLSCGQRQRIAIARAAIRQSRILILDEPTTGLDEDSQKAVMEALDRLSKSRTTFLVTHNLKDAMGADLVLFIENGRIREMGPPADLLARDSAFARLFRGNAPSIPPDNPVGMAYAAAV